MSSTEIGQHFLRSARFPVWLWQEKRRNAALYGTIVLFVLVTLLIATIRGDSILQHVLEYGSRLWQSFLMLSSAIVAWVCLRALVQGRHQSPVSFAVANLKALLLSSMLARYLYGSAILALFMGAFLYNKTMIPVVVPFQWDETFARWDAALLGGYQPWQILQPMVGMPWITLVFDVTYTLWVPMVFLFWAGLLASPRVPEAVRVRYWRATVASWILIGLVMATIFSSAGPCYFADVVPGTASPYADLMSYLDDVAASYPLSSNLTRDFLWQVYTGQVDLPGGISAMPSMHNAQAALFVVVAYSIDRRFGHVMLAFGALIFFGSIHLGWHYAVDGIVAIPAALAIWWACGKSVQVKRPRFLESRSKDPLESA